MDTHPKAYMNANTMRMENYSIDYRLESARLGSYGNWTVPYLNAAQLAAAGFFFTGESDRVKCFECGVEIFDWVEGDNPKSDHQRWRPTCKFVRNLPCGNVPIGVDPDTVPIPTPRIRDVCERYGEHYRSHTSPNIPSTARLGSLGLVKPKGSTHPEYACYESRLRTFNNWPKSMPQTKEQLADAGFFYTGRGDETQCYHCGGGLKDWEPKDDPWQQHAKWFTKCYYVLMVKGQSFIDNVLGQRVAPLTREEMLQMNLPGCIGKVEKLSIETEEKEANDQVASSSYQNSPSEIKDTDDDGRICKICFNEELGIVFLPCRHMVACVKCALDMTACAVCRKKITMTVHAIIS